MSVRRVAAWVAGAAGLAGAGYAAYAARAWWRYGRRDERPDGPATLLDQFMPEFDLAERHWISVSAPAAETLATARALDLQRSGLVRAIFRVREVVMGSGPPAERVPGGFVSEVLALGWGILADVPDREVVLGAVTQPWEADVHFRAVPPEAFAPFREAGLVKIAWNLSVRPTGPDTCVLRTETRVVTSDAHSRSRFRRYWALASPGILLIRRQTLRLAREEAERRHRAAAAA